MDLTREIEVLTEAIRLAGAAVEKIAAEGTMDTAHKADRSPVTAADLAANKILHAALLGAFPADGWLSEETADDPRRLACRRVWVVDPIDGTLEFTQHVPHYAVSVALVENAQPVLGMVYNPARDELFVGVPGAEATLNGHPIHAHSPSPSAKVSEGADDLRPGHFSDQGSARGPNVSTPLPEGEGGPSGPGELAPLGGEASKPRLPQDHVRPGHTLTPARSPAQGVRPPNTQIKGSDPFSGPFAARPVILASRSEIKRGEFAPFDHVAEIQAIGSIAYKLALVAAGRADGTFSLGPKHEWDIAAGVAIVQAAGGVVTDKAGQPFRFNQPKPLTYGLIAACPESYDRIVAMIHHAAK